MTASIVICTYGRPGALKNLLSELGRQGCSDFEIVVIFQGGKEDLEKVKDSTRIIYPVRYFHEARRNLPHARNIGIRESSGEIVIFLDDDTRPDSALVEAHVANYVDLAVGIVGGRVLGEIYKEDIPDYKIGKVRSLDGLHHGGFHKNVRRDDVMHVRGVNMSVRKELVKDIGGFDERFEGTAEYEDMDFCLRALRKGYKIIFDPTAVVEHFASSTGGCRMATIEESAYWLYRNHSLLFLNNLNKFFYPLFITQCIGRMILRSLKWHNPRIITSAFKGIRDGWSAHFARPQRIS
jgi:GT2 family glycosyltransferase